MSNSPFFWPKPKTSSNLSQTPLEYKTALTKPKTKNCYTCGLYKQCNSPRMSATGKGEKGILIIAEAPGETEDRTGIQLTGKIGQKFRTRLNQYGINLDRDCRKINSINCRPPENRTPTDAEIEACRSRVWKEIKEFKPQLILLMGNAAIKSFLKHRWKKDLGGITKWRGWQIPDRETNAWVCPVWHSSFIERSKYNPAVEAVYRNDLRKAFKYLNEAKPNNIVIDINNIEILTTNSTAWKYLYNLIKHSPKIIALDFETTGLKPHAPGHRIVGCSIYDGENPSTAFLVNTEKTKEMLKAILNNKNIQKIGANIKFEQMWAQFILGIEIQGWKWDTNIAQHCIDNREGICSVKFMGYIYEGVVDYDSHIEPFLKSAPKAGANAFNRIDDIPIHDLLEYNARDSLLEYHIGIKQMIMGGIKI